MRFCIGDKGNHSKQTNKKISCPFFNDSNVISKLRTLSLNQGQKGGQSRLTIGTVVPIVTDVLVVTDTITTVRDPVRFRPEGPLSVDLGGWGSERRLHPGRGLW